MQYLKTDVGSGRPQTSNRKNVEKQRLMDREKYYNSDPKIIWAKKSFYKAKTRALRRGLEFTITLDELNDLCGDECAYSKMILDYSRGKRCVNFNSPTMDRIDNKFGYISGNVAVVSHYANVVKNDKSLFDFITCSN